MFIPPNRYAPRPAWAQVLTSIGPKMHTPEFDLVAYWQWRTLPTPRPIDQAWADLRMTVETAKKALAMSTKEPDAVNMSSIIPPEIFSRLLARARGSTNPSEIADDAVLE